MAIDIETFEKTPEDELRELSNPEKVLQFLIANDDQAFKATEIAERTEINRNSISTVLGRLEDRDLVRHKGEYWAIGDRERIRSFDRYRRATERLNERYGPEDKDAWRAHAVGAETRNDGSDDGE
ncbi:helix-turn-helix domain-containing protein [Natronococcus sp. A-GB7]|jgi:MarR family transcriptional regulator, temperature-dependent positive regulator of motility|uniref:MarR family transcriptional regulator n=1 Tax=Natronococcus sp. A-GB7 TaxID=3037649 RepID=UPI00241E8DD2|nr:helix-turn-helix domain-containing protein [Natronococcus sp. A-GB7]MDG5817417.1 helix-turn-helix domain-containing protein [Natronococcus sp. A-GB7]